MLTIMILDQQFIRALWLTSFEGEIRSFCAALYRHIIHPERSDRSSLFTGHRKSNVARSVWRQLLTLAVSATQKHQVIFIFIMFSCFCTLLPNDLGKLIDCADAHLSCKQLRVLWHVHVCLCVNVTRLQPHKKCSQTSLLCSWAWSQGWDWVWPVHWAEVTRRRWSHSPTLCPCCTASACVSDVFQQCTCCRCSCDPLARWPPV